MRILLITDWKVELLLFDSVLATKADPSRDIFERRKGRNQGCNNFAQPTLNSCTRGHEVLIIRADRERTRYLLQERSDRTHFEGPRIVDPRPTDRMSFRNDLRRKLKENFPSICNESHQK